MAEFGETSARYQANIASPDHRNAHGLIPYNQTGTTGRPDLQSLGNIPQDGRQVFVHVGPRQGKSDIGMQETDQIGRAHVELQSLMRISYAVFCLKKKKNK